MVKEVSLLLNVEEVEGSKVLIPSQEEDVQVELASQRSADPVSRITSYATGGVPTAMEPKKLESEP